MRTHIFVDGYNLYYGSLRKTPYKWLDIQTLCRKILTDPAHVICKLNYFTARVTPSVKNPDVHTRQNFYLRALRSVSNTEVIFGNFQTHTASRPLASPLEVLIENPFTKNKVQKTIYYADVKLTNEKGSDVNLATRLLVDGISDLYDAAVVISNDSDLVAPIKHVKNVLKKRIIILNPHLTNSYELKSNSNKVFKISPADLAASQFPSSITDKQGTFHKPPQWN